MIFTSLLLVIFVMILSTTDGLNPRQLCKGKPYGSLVPNPNDCTSFYVCHFIAQLTECAAGLHFDRRHKVCNWPQFADCHWVDPEDILSHPETTSPDDKPSSSGEESLSSESDSESGLSKESEELEAHYSNSSEESQSEEGEEISIETEDNTVNSDEEGTEEPMDHDNQKSLASTHNDVTSKRARSPTHYDRPTVADVITNEPQTTNTPFDEIQDYSSSLPTVYDEISVEPQKIGTSTEEPHDNTSSFSIIGDMITEKPREPSVSSTDIDDNQFSSTKDDEIISYTTTINSDSSDQIAAVPEPNHPKRTLSPSPLPEDSDQHKESSERIPSTESDQPETSKLPSNEPTSTEGSIELPTISANHSSQLWNLISSIVSVESSDSEGFINFPTVGAHSPETGYPLDVMTGYDPTNVQCLHNGLYFLPHPSNCQKYFICAYRHLYLHSCGHGVLWNHKRQQCDLRGYARCYSRDVESEQSTERATPFIDDVTQKTRRSNTPTKLPVTTVIPKLPMCPAMRQSYLPHLDDCHRYYICIMGKPVLTSCPSGMHWDAVEEFCGKPSLVRCARRK